MSRPLPLRRFLLVLPALLLAGAILPGAARAQEKKLPPTLADDSREIEPKLTEAIGKLTERAAELRREQAATEMDDLIARLQAEHQLEKPALDSLEKAAKESIDASMEPWAEDFRNFITLQMTRLAPRYYFNTESMLQSLSADKADTIVDRFQSPLTARPEAQKAWTAALTELLGKEAFAEFSAGLRREREERREEVSEFLDDYFKDQHKTQLKAGAETVSRIVEELGLEEASKAKLDSLLRDALVAHLNAERADTGFVLERTLPDRWSGFASMSQPIQLPASETWRDGLAKILSSEQLATWDGKREEKQREEEKKFAAILEMSEGNLRDRVEARMTEERERLADAIELAPDTREKLAAAAEEAVTATLDAWKEEGLALFRRLPDGTRESVLQANRFTTGFGGALEPHQQAPWTEALKSLLTPAQQASWEAEVALWDKEQQERLEEMIVATAENYEPMFQANLDPRISDVITSLRLDEKRAAAFRKAAEKAVEQSLDTWKERAREWLEGLSEEQRRNYTEQGRVPLGYNESDAADQQPAWKTAFRTILTPEERATWEETQKNRRQSRREAVSELLVAQVEEWVGIDPNQWSAIADLCREPAEDLAAQFNEQHYYVGVSEIARVLRTIDEKKLRDILDDSQWKRWEQAVEMLATQNQSSSRQNEPPSDVPPGPDPRYVEAQVTQLLSNRNGEMKQEFLLRMTAEIEVCSRAADLPGPTVEILQTAAKGAVEEVVNLWDASFAKYVRQRARGANPRTIHQQLAGVGRYGRRMEDPLEKPVWKRTIETLLAPEQREQWQAASDARNRHRQQAIAGTITAFFETRLGLGAEQTRRFREKIDRSLETYGPDIAQVFTSYSSPWYLQYYSIGMPLMGIPEEELKALLSKEQFETWETQFRGNAANYWDNIESYHRQRKQKEEKEAGQKKEGQKDS